MKLWNIAIVDDEPVARQRLRRLIGIRDDCRIIGEYGDGAAMSAALRAVDVDLVMLDIDMPGADGFASLATLPDPKPLVIFVTAFSDFAARAYDIDAVDYLLKPVSGERLGEAIGRAERRRRASRSGEAILPTSTAIVRFAVQGRVYLIEQARISTVRALGNFVEITTDIRRYELRMTLRSAFAKLDRDAFVQVHRSWVVARHAVVQTTSLPGSRADILLKDGRRIPQGRAFCNW
ncbi:LytTR family DNA-binding domain-containing protein [Sphingomonas sp. SUN039]|uniref:LytR/AlgR family response regulator transcription factor n=1 Tax=Sphingomonas sp. SUN039 TaxID=2937787 RepID=UPI0021647EBF|nr:LytTR family DNA-binding domain-containing protein [Sphingomonas sp. SUN039]